MIKKLVLIFAISLFSISLVIALGGDIGDEDVVEEDYVKIELEDGQVDIDQAEQLEQDYNIKVETTPEGDNNWDFTDMSDDGYLEFEGTTSETSNWETAYGPINNYQLTDALFKLGGLAQASLVSFENNNNLFFGSVFDGSVFQIILNQGDEASIAQRNSMGDTGNVYIQMNSGNLTQDGTIIFIPDGNNPTYIYNNESSVEFEDGTVYYGDEYITNPDNTEETTTFDIEDDKLNNIKFVKDAEYGFNGKYLMKNTNRNAYTICKDSECDIEVSDERVKMAGKIELYYDEEIVYESFDSNNIASLVDFAFNIDNTNPKNELKAVLYTGHHIISEGLQRTSAVVEEEYPYVIRTYTSSWMNVTLVIDEFGDLHQGNIHIYVTGDDRPCEIVDKIGIVCEGSLISITTDAVKFW